MFGFLTIQPVLDNNPFQSLATASRWLHSHCLRNSVAHQRSVLVALKEVAALPTAIGRDCAAAIECIDGAMESERRCQIAQYVANADRSAAIASSIWNSLYEMNDAFIGAYKAALRGALAPQRDAPQPHVARLLVLLIRHLALEIELRAFRYKRLNTVKWGELHALYRQAVEREVERVPVVLAGADAERTSTAEREYLHALLLDRINTGNLTPVEFDIVSERLRDWTSGMTLDAEPHVGGGFVVQIEGKTGLARRAGNEHGNMFRFIDTTHLVSRFKSEMGAFDQPQSNGRARAGHLDSCAATAFAKAWPALSMAPATDHRRAPRTFVASHAIVAVGIAHVCDQLSSEAGAIRKSRGEASTTWTIVDRSDTSFRLRSAAAARMPIAVGMLLAIRPAAQSGSILGVARRVSRPNDDVVEVGVSILTDEVVAATFHIEQAVRDDMHFVVDGIDMSGIGAVFRGLYIPPRQRSDARSIGTLIVPTTNHDIGRRAVIAAGDEVRTLTLREPLEQHADWTWTMVEARRAA